MNISRYLKEQLKVYYLFCRRQLLSSISKAFSFKTPSSLPDKIRKILVITPPRIGDIAIASPVFYALKRKCPNAEIYVRANLYTSSLMSFIKPIDHVLIEKDSFYSRFEYLFLQSNPKFDLAIDLNFDYYLWTALVAGLASDFSIGYDIDGRGFLFSKKLPKPYDEQHAADVLLEPIRNLFSFDEEIVHHLEVPAEIKIAVDSILADIHISANDEVVLIHPGAHHPTQQWLPEYFAETADNIIEYESKKLVFVGGPNERILIKHIVSFMKKAPDGIFTDLGIKNLVGIIQRADLLICNNSGPLHIAVATNTPTISTLGPTLEKRWAPRGDVHKVFRINDLPCIGCNLGYCKTGTHDCMRLITPSIVFRALKTLLSH